MEYVAMQKITHTDFLRLIKGKTLAFLICHSHSLENYKSYVPKIDEKCCLSYDNYINVGKVIKVSRNYFKREYKYKVGGYNITTCELKNTYTYRLNNLLVVITERKRLLYKIME